LIASWYRAHAQVQVTGVGHVRGLVEFGIGLLRLISETFFLVGGIP
jgi:hypothetical protein